MSLRWMDELVGDDSKYAPDPGLESFYILVALELGDPDGDRWLELNATAFYALWDKFRATSPKYRSRYLGATVALQYLQWYEANRPTVDTRTKAAHSQPTHGAEEPQKATAYREDDGFDEGRHREDDTEPYSD